MLQRPLSLPYSLAPPSLPPKRNPSSHSPLPSFTPTSPPPSVFATTPTARSMLQLQQDKMIGEAAAPYPQRGKTPFHPVQRQKH